MTPGPIAPRVPVDPGPQSLRMAEGEPGRSDERPSFADLLQAMLAPAAAPVATPGASDPETPAAVFERLDAARVFNETGLFRGAAPLAEQVAAEAGPPPDSGAPALADTGAGRPLVHGAPVRREISAEAALQLSLAPAPGTAPAAPEGEAPGQATAARQMDLAGGSLPPNATPMSREAIQGTRSLRGQPVAAPQPQAETPEAARPSAAAGRRSETAAMLLQAHLAKGGSTAAQVSVQAVEGGVSLVARADKLSREERDKLRIEIGELLARHGLTAAQIMVNGEAWLSPQGRDE